MNGMFACATHFDRDISRWNVSDVRDFADMFAHASSFDRRLDDWEVSPEADVTDMLNGDRLARLFPSWSYVRFADGARLYRTAHLPPTECAAELTRLLQTRLEPEEVAECNH